MVPDLNDGPPVLGSSTPAAAAAAAKLPVARSSIVVISRSSVGAAALALPRDSRKPSLLAAAVMDAR